VLVGLVGDDECVVLLCQSENTHQLIAGEHASGGVGWIAEDQGFGTLRKRLCELVRIKRKLGSSEWNIDRSGSCKDRIRGIIFVKRRKDDDTITWITSSHHRDHHGFGAPAGNHKMLIRIEVQAGEMMDFFCQSGAKAWGTPGNGILVKGFP